MAVAMNYAGACPAADAEHLAIAMEVWLDQLYDCLNAGEGTHDAFNFLAWAKLLVAETMLSWKDTHLYVYCNDTCDGTLAATEAYGSWSQGPMPGQSIAINLRSPAGSPPSFTLSDNQLSETLTHGLCTSPVTRTSRSPWALPRPRPRLQLWALLQRLSQRGHDRGREYPAELSPGLRGLCGRQPPLLLWLELRHHRDCVPQQRLDDRGVSPTRRRPAPIARTSW